MTWEYPTRADLKARHGNINFDSFIEPVATPDNPVVNLQQEDTPSYEVVWEPIPGTSQEMAITCPANHILYCGARGPGKTITQLMRYRARVGIGYGQFWRGIIFDREFKNLKDLVAQSLSLIHI